MDALNPLGNQTIAQLYIHVLRLYNEVVVTAPTIGSNVEEVMYKNIRFVMWGIFIHFCCYCFAPAFLYSSLFRGMHDPLGSGRTRIITVELGHILRSHDGKASCFPCALSTDFSLPAGDYYGYR